MASEGERTGQVSGTSKAYAPYGAHGPDRQDPSLPGTPLWRQRGPIMIGLALLAAAAITADTLTVHLVGNAGVILTDRTTTLLVDLPYRSGAFGYQTYDPTTLPVTGDAVSVVTHAHLDHFEPALFGPTRWRIIASSQVTRGLPADRVLDADSVQVGAFGIVAVPTPHTDGHRSYRVRWRSRVLYLPGDTEDAGALARQPPLDVLFLTPWLACTVEGGSVAVRAGRRILYHLAPDGSDRSCGDAERPPPGTQWRLSG